MKKFDIRKAKKESCYRNCKNNTINSIFEVNAFLSNFNIFCKCLKFYNIIKK